MSKGLRWGSVTENAGHTAGAKLNLHKALWGQKCKSVASGPELFLQPQLIGMGTCR